MTMTEPDRYYKVKELYTEVMAGEEITLVLVLLINLAQLGVVGVS